jgi:TatD DNase family protein
VDPLADSHVHLEQYPVQVQQGLVERAQAAGVELLLAVSVSLASSRRSLALAQRFAGVYAAVGVHPRRLRRQHARSLEALASDPRVRAIGEVGLEYAPSAPSPEVQRAFLIDCLDLARQLGRAVALHVVGPRAHADALAVLGRYASGPPVIVHYFAGDEHLAAAYLAVGCSLSVGKPATRAENAALRTAVRTIPPERLLLETDAYPLSGRTTEPRDLVDICRTVAALRDESPEAVARTTTGNFRRLLGMLSGHAAGNGPVS